MKALRKPLPRNGFTALLLWLTLLFSFGCFQEYYRAKENNLGNVQEALKEPTMEKYFIVHQRNHHYHLYDLALSGDQLQGELELLPIEQTQFINTDPEIVNRYKGKKEKHILNQVHIWMKDDVAFDLQASFQASPRVTIASEDIHHIEFYEKDQPATMGNHILSAVGIAAAVSIITFAIVASRPDPPPPTTPSGTTSSCPFLYTFDGDRFRLAGELFPGALLPNLERQDFLRLPDQQPLDGQQVVRLRNELQEIQYINHAELITVDHPEAYEVLLDPSGIAHGIRDLIPALEASTAEGRPALALVNEREDNLAYPFADPEAERPALRLRFPKPENARQAKLVLRARNTPWLELIWLAFNQKYGGYYDAYFEKMGREPAEELVAWMADQDLMLTVELRTDQGWETREQLLMAGPLAFRDLIVPLDLSKSSSTEVELRLRTGFQFWELDYAGLSFDDDPPLKVAYHPLRTAYASDGRDYLPDLRAADTSYLVQARIGDQVELTFDHRPAPAGQAQTVFLKSRGYYEPLRDFSGLPEVLSLRHFDRPGYFSTFSRQLLREALSAQGIRWMDDNSPQTQASKSR